MRIHSINQKVNMAKIVSLLICMMLLSCVSTKLSTIPPDLKDPYFLKYDAKVRSHFDIALDLYMYDMLAWTSSDSVSNRLSLNPDLKEELGAEWFIYQDKDSNYHAVYGKYYSNDDIYKSVFHFILDNEYNIKAVKEPVDSSICLYYARAINRSFSIVDKFVREKNLKLNWYVLVDSLGRLNVWYLPGQLSNDFEVYGGDFQYIFGATGKQIIDSIWSENEFKIVKPAVQKQITLINDGNEYPTVDNIFCALNILRKYKQSVFMVYILSRNYLSAIAKNKDAGYSWIHSKRK